MNQSTTCNITRILISKRTHNSINPGTQNKNVGRVYDCSLLSPSEFLEKSWKKLLTVARKAHWAHFRCLKKTARNFRDYKRNFRYLKRELTVLSDIIVKLKGRNYSKRCTYDIEITCCHLLNLSQIPNICRLKSVPRFWRFLRLKFVKLFKKKRC